MLDNPFPPDSSSSSSNPKSRVEITHIGYSSFAECISCRFFVGNDYSDSGVCHRYPHAELVHPDYWCGEWKSINPEFRTK